MKLGFAPCHAETLKVIFLMTRCSLSYCDVHGKPAKTQDLLDVKQTALKKSISEGKDYDDLKPIAQKIHVAARNALKPSKNGK